MHITNAVKGIRSSFRNTTKQGAFPNENALLIKLYLRVTELYAKRQGLGVQDWTMVIKQLPINRSQTSEKY